jgi:hypothetical protein
MLVLYLDAEVTMDMDGTTQAPAALLVCRHAQYASSQAEMPFSNHFPSLFYSTPRQRRQTAITMRFKIDIVIS